MSGSNLDVKEVNILKGRFRTLDYLLPSKPSGRPLPGSSLDADRNGEVNRQIEKENLLPSKPVRATAAWFEFRCG